jgi:peptidoglycan/LPS O-acetylase OafA/YrhL
MKQKSQRIIALDYFRGICILAVILSHSAAFSTPFAYLAGGGKLWTSAAEMFFLLSGITFGVVRGNQITSGFKTVWRKSWQRARSIYLLHISVVFISLLMAYFFISRGLVSYMPGALPNDSGLSLIAKVASFYYVIGFAAFLMYYVVFLLIAPFALYILRTRLWAAVPLASVLVFLLNASPVTSHSHYLEFAIWQFYFFIGLTLARFRLPLIGWFYSLPKAALRSVSASVVVSAGVFIALAALVASSTTYSMVYKLAEHGWLPVRIQHAYAHLLNHKPAINFWLGDSRFGALRPVATLVIFAAAYIIYQNYKKPLLKHTGDFVNTMGRDTLWLFSAQALVIPIIAALPIAYGGIAINLAMTSFLFGLMWLITKRRSLVSLTKAYSAALYLSVSRRRYDQPQPVSIED